MNSWCRWRGMQLPMTMPSSKLRAANNVVAPWRLQSCLMIPQRPFFKGRPGWVRSRDWSWLFSSTHEPRALSGG